MFQEHKMDNLREQIKVRLSSHSFHTKYHVVFLLYHLTFEIHFIFEIHQGFKDLTEIALSIRRNLPIDITKMAAKDSSSHVSRPWKWSRVDIVRGNSVALLSWSVRILFNVWKLVIHNLECFSAEYFGMFYFLFCNFSFPIRFYIYIFLECCTFIL